MTKTKILRLRIVGETREKKILNVSGTERFSTLQSALYSWEENLDSIYMSFLKKVKRKFLILVTQSNWT